MGWQRATGDAGGIQSDEVLGGSVTAERATHVHHGSDVIGDIIVMGVTWSWAEKSHGKSARIVAGYELVDAGVVAPIRGEIGHVVQTARFTRALHAPHTHY